MTVLKARDGKVKVCATESGTYYELADYVIGSAQGFDTPEQMDTTHMGDVAARSESSGFYTPQIELTLHRNTGDTTGQNVLLGNNPVWVQYADDGSTFKKCLMSYTPPRRNHAAGADKLTLSISLKAAGGAAPASV
jgi:hypothetical protein